jgi:hypothetical protein
MRIKGRPDATEQYAARFKRRGDARKRKQFKDYVHGVVVGYRGRDSAQMSKPNHTARAQDIEGVFAGAFKPQTPTAWFPNVGGIRIVGAMGRCPRTLVAWSEEVDTAGPSDHPVTRYFAYAYPCVVDHGMKRHTKLRFGLDLVPVTGKPGEHRDSLGRTW